MAMKTTGQALSLRGLSKTFIEKKTGKELEVLDSIDLEIEPGSLTCLVGPSGCGKTTLLRLIGGLEMPTSGEVLFEGEPVTGPGPERGMVFQEYALFPWRTVLKNVSFGLDIEGMPTDEARRKAAGYLETVGLTGHEDLYPRELSGGMKKRVGFARAIAMDHRIVFFDEPSTSLDPIIAAGLDKLILEMRHLLGITVFVVTHDLGSIRMIADRIVMLDRGHVIFTGTIADVEKTNVPRVRQFFDRQPDKTIEARGVTTAKS